MRLMSQTSLMLLLAVVENEKKMKRAKQTFFLSFMRATEGAQGVVGAEKVGEFLAARREDERTHVNPLF